MTKSEASFEEIQREFKAPSIAYSLTGMRSILERARKIYVNGGCVLETFVKDPVWTSNWLGPPITERKAVAAKYQREATRIKALHPLGIQSLHRYMFQTAVVRGMYAPMANLLEPDFATCLTDLDQLMVIYSDFCVFARRIEQDTT